MRRTGLLLLFLFALIPCPGRALPIWEGFYPNGGGGGGAIDTDMTTGAVGVWDGSEIGEGSAGCVDAGGVLTCDGFVARASTAPTPVRIEGLAQGCDADQTYKAAIPFLNADAGCGDWDTGGLALLRRAGIPVNQDRALTLRSMTIALWGFGAVAGWQDTGTGEAIEFTISVCTLDPTPAHADCTDVDTFVVQNEATPTIQYGGGSANARTAASCVSGSCVLTWPIDGAGRLTSSGDPTWDAGAVDYIVVWFENDAANFNAEGGTTIDTINAAFTLDSEN